MSDDSQLTLIASVISATDEADLLKRMQAAASASGFDHVLFGIELRRPFLDPIQHITSGFPEAYQELYQSRNYIMRDPSVAYCQTHEKPLIWGEAMYSEPSYEIMEESRKHGLGHGFSVPVRESNSVVSMLSLGRDRPFESEAEKRQVIDAGNVLANCVHVASKKIIVPEIELSLRPNLSPRETECLKWLAAGKSNGVIADLMKISEVTVEFHVKNIYKKLNVATRLQAAVVAMSMGMIT